MTPSSPRVALLVTCLVDLFRPSIGFAAVKLLEESGCIVEVPEAQTCCGQPAYNSGDRGDAAAIARHMIAAFAGYDYVVVPSGSCGGMLRKHYPGLFAPGTPERAAAEALSARTHELISFLTDVMGLEGVAARFPHRITYHDSCSGLRELGIERQPRALLATVEGLEIAEMGEARICCGFGGMFCVKYPDISNDMLEKKTASIAASGAEVVLAGDLGCLMNMAGKLKRLNSKVESRHVAEVLAGMAQGPAIGEAG